MVIDIIERTVGCSTDSTAQALLGSERNSLMTTARLSSLVLIPNAELVLTLPISMNNHRTKPSNKKSGLVQALRRIISVNPHAVHSLPTIPPYDPR
jgi:hypothetical protein